MEARILKMDMTLGKRIYKRDAPYDIEKLGEKLKKNMVAVGRWKNTKEPFVYIYRSEDYFLPIYLSKEMIYEILSWMKKVKEED